MDTVIHCWSLNDGLMILLSGAEEETQNVFKEEKYVVHR